MTSPIARTHEMRPSPPSGGKPLKALLDWVGDHLPALSTHDDDIEWEDGERTPDPVAAVPESRFRQGRP